MQGEVSELEQAKAVARSYAEAWKDDEEGKALGSLLADHERLTREVARLREDLLRMTGKFDNEPEPGRGSPPASEQNRRGSV